MDSKNPLINTLAIILLLIVGIPLAFCVILGADRGDFQLIAIGSIPLATAMGAVVTYFFREKTIASLKAENKALKATKED